MEAAEEMLSTLLLGDEHEREREDYAVLGFLLAVAAHPSDVVNLEATRKPETTIPKPEHVYRAKRRPRDLLPFLDGDVHKQASKALKDLVILDHRALRGQRGDRAGDGLRRGHRSGQSLDHYYQNAGRPTPE